MNKSPLSRRKYWRITPILQAGRGEPQGPRRTAHQGLDVKAMLGDKQGMNPEGEAEGTAEAPCKGQGHGFAAQAGRLRHGRSPQGRCTLTADQSLQRYAAMT